VKTPEENRLPLQSIQRATLLVLSQPKTRRRKILKQKAHSFAKASISQSAYRMYKLRTAEKSLPLSGLTLQRRTISTKWTHLIWNKHSTQKIT